MREVIVSQIHACVGISACSQSSAVNNVLNNESNNAIVGSFLYLGEVVCSIIVPPSLNAHGEREHFLSGISTLA